MCVFSSHPFWTSSSLDVPAGVTQEEGHTGFLIHLPSAVRALIFVARRIQPFLSLVDREVEWVWEIEAYINIDAKGSTRLELLEVYWPCAGGLSAVNASGTQLRDPTNSGLRACKTGEPTQGGRGPNPPRETKKSSGANGGRNWRTHFFAVFVLFLFCFVFMLRL